MLAALKDENTEAHAIEVKLDAFLTAKTNLQKANVKLAEVYEPLNASYQKQIPSPFFKGCKDEKSLGNKLFAGLYRN